MFNLLEKTSSYMIISPEIESYNQLDNNFRSQKLNNILYAKGYTIFPLIQHKDGVYLKSFIATTNEGNSTLKKDSIFFMNELLVFTILILLC